MGVVIAIIIIAAAVGYGIYKMTANNSGSGGSGGRPGDKDQDIF